MLNILICDDEKPFLDRLANKITVYLENREIPFQMAAFCSGEELLKHNEDRLFDIAFLDIDMEKLNGINLARKLRQENPGIVIIFLTNFIQYAPEGFEVQAFRYLLKSDMQERLVSYFEDAVREVVREKQIITISVNAELIDIPVSHILYLESNLRVVTMHLINDDREEYRFYGNMTDLSEKLEALGFLRVQKSFLVNMEYIEQLQYEKVSLYGGIVLPSSAKNHKTLKQQYLKWRGKNRWAIF